MERCRHHRGSGDEPGFTHARFGFALDKQPVRPPRSALFYELASEVKTGCIEVELAKTGVPAELEDPRGHRGVRSVYVVDALKRWEPRVVVTAVETRRERRDGENALFTRVR